MFADGLVLSIRNMTDDVMLLPRESFANTVRLKLPIVQAELFHDASQSSVLFKLPSATEIPVDWFVIL